MTLRFFTAVLLALSVAAGAAAAAPKRHDKTASVHARAALPSGPRDRHSLYVNGAFIGADPDPAIRAQLLRDFYTGLANW